MILSVIRIIPALSFGHVSRRCESARMPLDWIVRFSSPRDVSQTGESGETRVKITLNYRRQPCHGPGSNRGTDV